ncbi:MAG: class II glutamine amidotransferase [Desulfatiglandaceae bacterium]
MLRSKTILKGLWKLGSIFMVLLILSGTGLACRMYGVISNDLPDGLLQDHLVDATDSLKALSNYQLDGWGIAYYPNYGNPAILERGAIRAYNDPYYDTVVGNINLSEPKITVAHIRTCVTGCCASGQDTVPNPHPFYRNNNGKTWTFAHNGVVSKTRMYDLLGDYLDENPLNGSDILPECNPKDPDLVVDTELYFLFVLKKIEENNWDAVNGIVEAVASMVAAGEGGGMNFIMSDGITVWGFKKGNSLSYSYDAIDGYSAVASQPPSSDGAGWTSMNDYELVVLTAGSAPLVMDVRDGCEPEICDNGIDDDCDGDIDCDDDDCARGPVLKDSDFNANESDDDLRDSEPPGEYWYESRGDVPTLLTRNTADIGGNNTYKAGFAASSSGNAYVTQQFSAAQTGIFAVQWDIYVDNILDDDNRDRAAMMMIGDGGGTGNGPNSSPSNRFVYMAFYSPGGGGDAPGDTMSLIASEPGDNFDKSSEWKIIASGLSFDAWHTIRVVCNLNTDTYDVYVNDDPSPQSPVTAYTAKTSVTHISFAQWNDGPGAFYVDNVSDANLVVFAAEFGQTDCAGGCLGDFNGDGDADGTDLAAFAEDLTSMCP